MRGQAFVSFTDIESANRARKEVNEFPLYGKAMVRCIHSRSCSVVWYYGTLLLYRVPRRLHGEKC